MLRVISLYVLALTMSLSILGPFCLAIIEQDFDIEVVQDTEDEKNETKNELEEFEKFFSPFPFTTTNVSGTLSTSEYYYIVSPYGHIKDIHSPPPDWS